MDTATQRAELQQSMDGLNAAIDARLAEIEELRTLLGKALTWEGRLNEAEQMIMQGDRERWKRIRLTVQYEQDLARAALNARRAGEGE